MQLDVGGQLGRDTAAFILCAATIKALLQDRSREHSASFHTVQRITIGPTNHVWWGERRVSITIDAPLEWVESVGSLRLPPKADQRLQVLMDRNTDGLLTDTERGDLESLVELSESLSLVRAEAIHLLGRKPE